MRDEPSADEILAAVAAYLRGPPSDPERAAFEDRVAAGALDIVRRDIALGPAAERAEHDRLGRLLGRSGSLADLNDALTSGLRQGALTLASEEVREHLWATTLEKLAIDQPRYPTYRAVMEAREPSSDEET